MGSAPPSSAAALNNGATQPLSCQTSKQENLHFSARMTSGIQPTKRSKSRQFSGENTISAQN